MMGFSLLNSKNFNIINYTIASHVYSESNRENMFFTDQRIGKNIIFLISNGKRYNDYETFVYVRDLTNKRFIFFINLIYNLICFIYKIIMVFSF